MGSGPNLKWVFSVQSSLSPTTSYSWPSSNSNHTVRGKDAFFEVTRVSHPLLISVKSETLYNNPLRAACSFPSLTLGSNHLETNKIKTTGERSCKSLYTMIDDHIQMTSQDGKLTFFTSLETKNASQFSTLLENLDMLEDTVSGSDAIKLERDILVQLERLGALKLFHTFLSRNLSFPSFINFYGPPTVVIEEPCLNDPAYDHLGEVIIRTKKKEERQAKRQRASIKTNKVYAVKISSKTNHKDPQHLNSFSARKLSNSRGRHLKVTRNEAELSRGVKIITELERVRMRLEKESGSTVSLGSWAAAAGIDKRVLHESLYFGWSCRDELLRSTRSLVGYLARSYCGQGVAMEDLIQAGNVGVLQGAERFDHSRGYKFSTYVQYWIRKNMSIYLAQHARGIRIPMTLNKAINQIQKARKALRNRLGKYPDDNEIAKFTGLTLAKVASASRCLRVIGSIDQKMWDAGAAKFLELTPDTTIEIPAEAVFRENMVNDLYHVLNGLEPRQRKVMVLRFGLGGRQRKSLEEIGRLFGVSKEWIRKIERTAFTKLKKDETLQDLRHYLYL